MSVAEQLASDVRTRARRRARFLAFARTFLESLADSIGLPAAEREPIRALLSAIEVVRDQTVPDVDEPTDVHAAETAFQVAAMKTLGAPLMQHLGPAYVKRIGALRATTIHDVADWLSCACVVESPAVNRIRAAALQLPARAQAVVLPAIDRIDSMTPEIWQAFGDLEEAIAGGEGYETIALARFRFELACEARDQVAIAAVECFRNLERCGNPIGDRHGG